MPTGDHPQPAGLGGAPAKAAVIATGAPQPFGGIHGAWPHSPLTCDRCGHTEPWRNARGQDTPTDASMDHQTRAHWKECTP
jgi:hypothetical protein